jgi:hypothetical protein
MRCPTVGLTTISMYNSSKGIHDAHDIDWPTVLADRLTATHPDVLRELPACVCEEYAGYGQALPGRTA